VRFFGRKLLRLFGEKVLLTIFSVDLAKSLNRMTYGVVCFATLFSLVGTILGGIWARDRPYSL
jgi:hypothetical protein